MLPISEPTDSIAPTAADGASNLPRQGLIDPQDAVRRGLSATTHQATTTVHRFADSVLAAPFGGCILRTSQLFRTGSAEALSIRRFRSTSFAARPVDRIFLFAGAKPAGLGLGQGSSEHVIMILQRLCAHVFPPFGPLRRGHKGRHCGARYPRVLTRGWNGRCRTLLSTGP